MIGYTTVGTNDLARATAFYDALLALIANPDLKIEKTAGSDTISAGDTATFSIKVTNLGPGTAYNVTAPQTTPAVTGVDQRSSKRRDGSTYPQGQSNYGA